MASNSNPVWAVVAAAGGGSRMQAEVAKQYLVFQGKTVLEHCLDRLLSHPQIDGAVLVLGADDEHWQQLGYSAEKPIFIANGGEQRQDSVYSGLGTLQFRCGNDVIALVHDAARPLVRHKDLSRVIEAAREHPAGAVLAAAVADTLKLANEDGEIVATQPRELLWRALTPQVFHLQSLMNALEKVVREGRQVTDEAQAVELQGLRPQLVAGSADNMKITRPGDLELAEMIWLHQRD
ncbi:MAG: 2-C-methyl-D-erythritol 4-phosphate cytidylyltransferase [Gammaproteobacteria bacterium]|nr:2-C-methyl-D-erythritol 4-phosphate cytidylyltransferase [Gammaproteobacteria bacterium]